MGRNVTGGLKAGEKNRWGPIAGGKTNGGQITGGNITGGQITRVYNYRCSLY